MLLLPVDERGRTVDFDEEIVNHQLQAVLYYAKMIKDHE